MAFSKYAKDPKRREFEQQQVSFRRAHLDGMPFLGPPALLREEEYDEYTEEVHHGYSFLFDLSNPEHHAKLDEIVDCHCNRWYRVGTLREQLVPQPDGGLKAFVFCIWSEPYRQLAKHRLPSNIEPAPRAAGDT